MVAVNNRLCAGVSGVCGDRGCHIVHQQAGVVDCAGVQHLPTGVFQLHRHGSAVGHRLLKFGSCRGAVACGERDAGVASANAAVCGHGHAVDIQHGTAARGDAGGDACLTGERGVAGVERVTGDGAAHGSHGHGTDQVGIKVERGCAARAATVARSVAVACAGHSDAGCAVAHSGGRKGGGVHLGVAGGRHGV